MSIQIKNKEVLTVLLLNPYSLNLVSLIEDLVDLVKGKDVVITEGWRPGGGVHSTSPCRAIDIRSWIYTKEELDEIETAINSLWTYDPKRPEKKCMKVHDTGKGVHAHLQVHPNSVRV